MHELIKFFQNLIDSPGKSTLAVITGTITGYIPTSLSVFLNIPQTKADTFLQHTVWVMTILVALTALISWFQKQMDRYRRRKAERKLK